MTYRGVMTVETAIDSAGFGKFQRRLFVVCGVTWAADAAEILMLGFALPQLTEEFGLTTMQKTLLVSAVFIGMLVGALFWGPLADRIGRRRGFLITVSIFSVFGILSAFAPNAEWLFVCRVMAGFGLGGAIPLDFSVFAEYLPSKRRGRWLVLLEAWWGIGVIAIAGLAWLLLPTIGWRPFFAASAAAALLVLWIRASIPESPRWLLSVGRAREARAVIDHVARVNGTTVPEGAIQLPPARQKTSRVALLWTKRLARTTALLWCTWFFISLAFHGFNVWLPSVFVERGFDFVRTYAYIFFLAFAQMPGFFLAAVLVDRWGRKRTLFTFLVGAAGATLLFALATRPWLVVGSVALFYFTGQGAWGALYCYTPEAYPTEIRSTGMGWASSMARIAGAASPVAGGLLLPSSVTLGVLFYATSFALAAVSVAIFGRETGTDPLRDTLDEVEPDVGGVLSVQPAYALGADRQP
jgi:putative MFS transporter